MRAARVLLVALLALLALAPATALAATPQTSLSDVQDEVMCPICGVPLNLAQSPQADRERAFIQKLVEEGRTKAEIKRALEDQYGPAVLAAPKSQGFDLTAYVVPIALVVSGMLGLLLMLPRWRRRAARGRAAEPEPALAPDDARRLDEDLARYGR